MRRNGRLKITEMITLSPAAVLKTLHIGDYLLSIDGVKIATGVNIDELLEGGLESESSSSVSSSPDGSNKREVVLKPISTGAEKNLLYRQWVESNRAMSKVSGGKLGYVHLPDM